MQKKFISSLGLILLLNLLVKPFYILGIDAEVQNKVGQETYGTYFALLSLSFIFNILIDFGINNFNNRNIAQNEQLIGKHFSKLFSVKALLAFIYAGFTLLLGFFLGYRSGAFFMLGILVFNQVLVSFILFARSNLAALHLFKSDSIISVLDRALLVVFCAILLFTTLTSGQFEIMWFVWLQTVAYAITLIVSVLLLGSRVGEVRWNFDRTFSLLIFKKSLPYALLILTGSMYTRIDGIMIENILEDGSFQAGSYAQGFRFYEAAVMFAFLFAVLLLPIYSRMLKSGEDVKPMVAISSRLLLGAGTFAAVFFFFNGHWVLNWRYDSVSQNAVWSFIALMIGFVGFCMFYIYGTLMTANENLRALNIISITGLVLNVLLNLFLIPKYLAFGAAITTMLTQLFAGSAQLLFVVRHFKMGINVKMILQFMAFTVLFTLGNYLLFGNIDKGAWRFWISAVGGLVLLIATGVVQLKQIAIFIKADN